MTYRDSEREAIVDELLLDADADTAYATDAAADTANATDAAAATDIRPVLLSMASFANLAAPTPGAELSAMLAGPHDEVSKRRWRHKHRTAVVSVAVVAAMGLGVSGVAAASSGFTRNPSFLDELLGNVRPLPAAAAPVLPAPDAPRVTTEPAQVVDPAAVPPIPAVTSIPVPGGSVPAETPPGQDVAHVPAAAAAPAAPASGHTQGNVAPNNAAPNNAAPNNAAPNNAAPNPQTNPAPVKEERQESAKPDASKQDAGKPVKPLPGVDGTKPGHLPPVLSNQRTDEEFQMHLDKWKQWLKRGGH